MQPPVRRRYRILQLLGSGGFANVYRAEMIGREGFSRPVAVKLLHADTPRHEQMLRRLRDEARILGRLRHPSAVGGLGIAHLEVGWAAVMDYVEGIDCAHVLRHSTVPVRVSLEIVAEVASVLDAAWNQIEPNGRTLGVLHRDIKPHNIVLDPRGGVRVLDFGAARAENVEREAHTRSVMLGTMRYLAPERHEGREEPAGDVYSLGVMLYEFIAGQPLRFQDLPGQGTLGERMQARVRDLIVERSLPMEPANMRALAQLVGDMTGYHPDFRPSASDIERRCRILADAVRGPSIRSWASEVVPPLLEARLASFGQDQLCGSVLVELAETTDTAPHPLGVEADTAGIPALAPSAPPDADPGVSTSHTVPVRSGALRVALAVLLGSALGCAGIAGIAAVLWPPPAPPAEVPEPLPPEPPPVEPEVPEEPPPKPPPKKKKRVEKKVEKKAEPEPKAEPPPPAPTYTIRVSGDVPEELIFQGGTRVRVRSGAPVPKPGVYSVFVRYAGVSELQKAGTVTVPDGTNVSVRCVASIPRCVLR